MRVTAPERITDLREWFDDVWAAGKEIEDRVLPSIDERVDVEPEDRRETAEIFDRLANAPDRDWVESLLDLMQESIRVAQLGDGDPRLVTSAAQDDRIVVTVNSRYVCGGFFEGSPSVGVILADGFSGVDEAVQRSVTGGYYRFSTRDGRDPHWVEFDQHPEAALSNEIEPAWEAAIENEFDRGTRSQYREYHDERVYRLIVDEPYRDGVLEELF